MKIKTKFKKIITAIVIGIITLPSKIFAMSSDLIGPFEQVLYGPPPEPTLTTMEIFLRIARIFIIPIAVAIGLIIYLKKSKSDKTKKILVISSVVIISVVLFFILNYLI